METTGPVINSINSIISSEIEATSSKTKAIAVFNDRTNLHQKKNQKIGGGYRKPGGVNEGELHEKGIMLDIGAVNANGVLCVLQTTVGLSLLPEQRKVLSHRKGGHFTLMAVGPAGSGKSTFINTLFGVDLLGTRAPPAYDVKPTNKITFHRFELVEKGFPLKLTAIDTPGFGQLVDNQYAWNPVTKFIDSQFKVHLLQEGQPNRSQLVDSRVHCCLYFIIPNGKGLSELDICSMRELSKRANLIPVIAKSDTFNPDDLIRFKEIVRRTLAVQDIKVCDLILDLNVKEQINSLMPFAIIGSNEFHESSQGKLIRGRKYKWGLAEVENEKHCDFLQLRDILMGNNMLDLILSTESHYENFRSAFLDETFLAVIKDKGLNETEIQRINNNGFEQFTYVYKNLLNLTENSSNDQDPVLLDKQYRMKERFSGIILNQERKFKEWKKALVDKQNVFNNDIEKLHNRIIRLQEIIGHMEAGYIVDDNSDNESTDTDDDNAK